MGRPTAGRPERQEDDGPHRRTGRRVAGGLLDRGGAGAASDGCGEAHRNGRQAGRFRRPCVRHQLGVGRQRRRGRLCRDAEDRAAERQDADDQGDADALTSDLLGFAGRDALGPALTGMLYSDLLYRFLPLPLLPDRAETLERAWEEAWDAPDASTACRPGQREPSARLSSRLRPKDGEPWRPLLIVQGASESGGRRMLTSAVKFTCDEVDADDFLARDWPRCRRLDRHPQWRALPLGQSGRHVHPSAVLRQRGRSQVQ